MIRSDWIPILQRLDGEFERGVFNQAYVRVLGTAPLGIIAWNLISESAGQGFHEPGRDTLLGLGALVLLAGLAAWVWRESGKRYRFNLGVLTCLSPGGRVCWERGLSDLTSVRTYVWRGSTSLLLEWPDNRKYIPFSAALEAAIERQWASLHSARDAHAAGAAQGATDAGSVEPAGSGWRCANCGEVVPEDFEACWKCESARPQEWEQVGQQQGNKA